MKNNLSLTLVQYLKFVLYKNLQFDDRAILD